MLALLFPDPSIVRKAGERLRGQTLHLWHQLLDLSVWFGARCEDGAETIAFHRKAQNGFSGGVFLHLQLGAAVEIEVAHPRRGGNLHLRSVHVIFVAIHDSPNGAAVEWPAAGEDSVAQHWIHRFPIAADEGFGCGALEGGDGAPRFPIAGRGSIPDAPNIFPALPTNPIEKRKLQIVGLAAVPAVGNVDNMAQLVHLLAVNDVNKS